MNPPNAIDFYDFLLCWFGGRVTQQRRESSDFVLSVEGLPENISINAHEPSAPLAIGHFNNLLRKCRIRKQVYLAVAGDTKLFKQFKKNPGAYVVPDDDSLQ
jgi:hypothetical protein